MPDYPEPMQPLTVERLIDKLKKMPQNAPVAIKLEVIDSLPLRNIGSVSLVYSDDSPDVDVVHISTATAHLHSFSAPRKERYTTNVQIPPDFTKEEREAKILGECPDGYNWDARECVSDYPDRQGWQTFRPTFHLNVPK